MSSNPSPSLAAPLVAIVGPTASGKSALGIAIAQRFGGEVVCCDSTQVYRHFDVGTAKVTPAEQRGIPHHMMDLVEPHEVFTAGEYRTRATAVLEDLRRRGKLPVLTVGTGLYLRALLEGLADAPARSEELRARLSRRARLRGDGYLHRVLARMDPAAAARIAPQDEPKLIRAIEVSVLAGKPISEVHRAGRTPLQGFRPTKMGLMPARKELYSRIERRTDAMLRAGWTEEVKSLLKSGLPETVKPFQFIGYWSIREYFNHELLQRNFGDQAYIAAAISQATRHYAKRQMTWFRKEPGVHWFEGFGDDPAIQSAALQYMEHQLAATRAGGGSGV